MLEMTTTRDKLAIRGLSKRYGSVSALDGVDLTVAAGEFLTVLGPSGSGKTTLLQVICGLVQPTSGQLLIDGRDCTLVPAHQRDLGVIFQSYALFPHMSVSENVAFPLEMRRLPAQTLRRKVDEALDLVGLAALGHRYPSELSGGQQQRVALARSLVYEPALILMDEPLGALDRKLRETMQMEIKRLHRDTGATIVFVTHDQDEALALSDRICLMNQARIAQIGTPEEIYGRPNSIFVADFIGISNFFAGRVGDGGLLTSDGRLPLAGAEAAAGTAMTLMVRPEAMALCDPGNGLVAGAVTERIYAGSETKYQVTLGSGAIVTVRRHADDGVVRIGDRVGVIWRQGDAQILADHA